MSTFEQLKALQEHNKKSQIKTPNSPQKEYFADGMSRQLAKETATLMAIRNGFALIRRNTEIHRVYSNGESRLLCSCKDLDSIWHKAHHTLLEQEQDASKRQQYAAIYIGHHSGKY